MKSSANTTQRSHCTHRRPAFWRRLTVVTAPLLFGCMAALATSNSITNTGPLAVARTGHAATLLGDGRVLVAGGTAAGAAVLPVEAFDPTSGSFQTLGSLQSGRLG